MNKNIKLFDPYVGKEEHIVINKILRNHNWASGKGKYNVLEFENKFKKYIGTKSCVAVNNGTSALHLAVSLFDIKDKEVIVPSMSFVSTAHSIIYNGGKPVFAEVDPYTLCLDPEEIKKKITSKTKMILPVHFGGMPADLDKLKKICKDHNCALVEDAAHAAGSIYKNKKIGTHGDAICFSFHPVKNLAMPTGGLVTLNDKNHLNNKELLKIRRWCGISQRVGSVYDVSELGWNMYMNEFSAAIGLIQLSRLDKLNKKRQNIAKRYNDEINLENKMPLNSNCSYHLFWLRVKNRSIFMKKMEKYGIETGIHYKPIHQMSFYTSTHKLPVTEKIGKEIVSIPIHPNLSDNDVDYIVRSINSIC